MVTQSSKIQLHLGSYLLQLLQTDNRWRLCFLRLYSPYSSYRSAIFWRISKSMQKMRWDIFFRDLLAVISITLISFPVFPKKVQPLAEPFLFQFGKFWYRAPCRRDKWRLTTFWDAFVLHSANGHYLVSSRWIWNIL